MLTDGPIREQLTNGVLPDQHRPLAPSRLSGDTRLSDAETAATTPAGGSVVKRLPRKLTKSRGNSDVGAPQIAPMAAPVITPMVAPIITPIITPTVDSGPKPKGVLQKKNRASAVDGSLDPAPGGSAASLLPFGAKKPDDGRRSHSFASTMSSGSKES